MIPPHYTQALPRRRTDWLFVASAFIVGFILFFAFFPSTSPVAAPTPTPVVTSDRDLVLGMTEVLIDVHRDNVRLRQQLDGVKTDAREIISALIEEIERLQCEPPEPIPDPLA